MPTDPIKRGPEGLDAAKRLINAAMRLKAPDIELARKIAYEVANRLHDRDVPEQGIDDLAQEALIAIQREWAKYDPRRGAPSTFMWGVASNRIKTTLRGARRRVHRDAVAFHDFPTETGPETVLETDDAALAEWITGIMATVRMVYVMGNVPLRHPKQNANTPDRVQRATLIALVQRMGWSYRQASRQLETRPAVLAALGLQFAPKYKAFSRATVIVSRIQKNLRTIPAAEIARATAPHSGE